MQYDFQLPDRGNPMKKILIVSAITLGFASSAAMADSSWSYHYSTAKHEIRVTCSAPQSNQCSYESWNKPKNLGQGKADLIIRHGQHTLYANGNSTYTFRTGNVTIELFDELRGNNKDSLEVSVNGNVKNRYRLYTHD